MCDFRYYMTIEQIFLRSLNLQDLFYYLHQHNQQYQFKGSLSF